MSKKQVLILVLIVALFLGGVFFLVLKDKKEKSKYLYLFSGDYKIVRWYYNDNKWFVLNQNEPLKDKFDVYSYGLNKGKYYLAYNQKWYYFDDKNDSYNIDGINFMINTNYDFKSYDFSIENCDDKAVETLIFNKMGIDENDYTANIREYIINENSSLYVADFYRNQDEYSPLGPNYTIMFSIDKSKIKVIKSMSFNIGDDSCSLGLVGLLNFDDSDKILINCDHFDQIPSDYYLYDANNHNLLVASKGGL